MEIFSPKLDYLSRRDPVLKTVIGQVGDISLQINRKRSMFEALVRAVAHQQLHGRAAENILKRFVASVTDKDSGGFPTPEGIMKLSRLKLRAVGFSNAKTRAVKDIARQTLAGRIPSRKEARKMTDNEIIQALTPLRGVGRWTAEMILIFTLGRMDVLPVDDFGIREGFKIAYNKKAQPKPGDLLKFGKRWAPYRTVASWYLWRVADKYKKTRRRK